MRPREVQPLLLGRWRHHARQMAQLGSADLACPPRFTRQRKPGDIGKQPQQCKDVIRGHAELTVCIVDYRRAPNVMPLPSSLHGSQKVRQLPVGLGGSLVCSASAGVQLGHGDGFNGWDRRKILHILMILASEAEVKNGPSKNRVTAPIQNF
jgi:hypothetical protein